MANLRSGSRLSRQAVHAAVVWGVFGMLAARCPADEGPPTDKSWTDTISSPFKQLGKALTPKPATPAQPPVPDDDAVSLKSKSKAGPGVYVALAKLHEEAGEMVQAEQHYQMALKEKPDDLAALLGYAHFLEYVGKPQEAIQWYQRAARTHPREAATHNNLGMCYARQGQLNEATAAMQKAVELEPKNALYCNNIAAVFVDQGKSREALAHLREVHPPAAAYYNLGYLLSKKGQTQAAMANFAMALKTDPSMEPARRWLDYLQRTTAQARLPQASPPASVARNDTTNVWAAEVQRRQAAVNATPGPVMLPPPPTTSQDVTAPRMPMTQRLPPIALRQPSMDGTPSRPAGDDHSFAPDAPLPPTSSTSGIRPLPRVN